jgi:hypothetical protein
MFMVIGMIHKDLFAIIAILQLLQVHSRVLVSADTATQTNADNDN